MYRLETPLSIVITTYNRPNLLKRCIKSIFTQEYKNFEIIVVDDHSTLHYEKDILNEFPEIIYIYQDNNLGPGIARNVGIKAAKNNFVLIMDDDDVFRPDAFKKVNKFLSENKNDEYPVYNFLRSNAKVRFNEYFYSYSFKEIIDDAVTGDLLHIINKKLFIHNKYMYPTTRIGAESLLWYQIALDYGFPIIKEDIVKLMDDSDDRLTNTNRQVKYANEFATYQLDIIKQFKYSLIENGQINFLIKKYMGAVTYLLLAGKRRQAFIKWKEMIRFSKKYYAVFPLLLLPRRIITQLFYKYR